MLSSFRRYIKFSSSINTDYTLLKLNSFQLPYVPKYSFTIKKKSSKIWMNEHINDIYVKKAKMYNYRSRAAFKLIEINQRYNILKAGYKVIDLGSAPGGWTQVAVEKVNSTIQKPLVLSIDKLPMTEVPGSHFIQGDMEDESTRIKIKEFFDLGLADVVLSDMAPNFSGDRDTDHMGIAVLNAIAFKVCSHCLRPGGTLLMKTLHGALEGEFFNHYKTFFKTFQRIKPSSSRARSSEIFYLGTGFKLSETYIKYKTFQDKLKQGKKLSENDLIQAGMNIEELKTQLLKTLRTSKKLNVPIEDDAYKLMEAVGINPNEVECERMEAKDDEEVMDELLKETGLQLSFMKTLPKNLKELKEFNDEKERKLAQKMKILKEGTDNDSLFEEEEEKDLQYEKMNSLADIDDIPDQYFEDEEKLHEEETSQELLETIQKLKQESKQLMTDYQEAIKNPKKFEEYIKENPEEFEMMTRMQNAMENFEEFEAAVDRDLQAFSAEDRRRAKEELRILKEKNKEFESYFRQGANSENLWKKK